MAPTLVKFGLFLGLVTLLVNILAIALPWWSYIEEEKFGEVWRTNAGLWEQCNRVTDVFGGTNYKCVKIQDPADHVTLARNTCILGLVLVFIGMIITCTGRWIMVDLQLVPLVGAFSTIVAGFLIWLGVLLFSESYVGIPGNEPWDVHAGWYLGLTAAFLCFITSILYLSDKVKDKVKDKTKDQSATQDPDEISQGNNESSSSKDNWMSNSIATLDLRLLHRGSYASRRNDDDTLPPLSGLVEKSYQC